MKPLAMLGLILIALGLAALVYQGVSYSSRETVLDLGPIHATAEREKTIPLPPIMGITAVVAGVALLVVGGRKGK
jgi:multisubunit Na+/H+ antiporter MnhC subunit